MTSKDRGIIFLPQPKSVRFNGQDSRLDSEAFKALTETRKQLSKLPDSISLQKSPNLPGNQAYKMQIHADSIELEATGETGWHYGVLTLRQIALASSSRLPRCTIEDSPDALEVTCGAWTREESASDTVDRVRDTFRKSIHRYKP